METTWQIFDTKRNISDGLITQVFYACTVEAEGEVERKQGIVELTGDSTTPGFVAFEELTQDVILGWVKTSIGVEKVTSIENLLKKILQSRKEAKNYITEQSGLPWA